MDFTAIVNLLTQLGIVVSSIIAGNTVLTGAVNGAFNVQKNWVKHLISWVLATVAGVVVALSGGLDTILIPGVEEITTWMKIGVGGACGLVAGGASNGLYDWEAVSGIIDKFYDLFGHKKETNNAENVA